MRKIILLFFLILINFISPLRINAQQIVDYSNIRLNEVMPNPEGSDTDYEWIEIYNDSSDAVDLSNCQIDGKDFTDGEVIDTEDYLVIAKDLLDSDEDNKSFERRWGNGSRVWGDSEEENFDVIEVNISLKNSSDTLTLTCGEYVNEFSWEDAPSGQSFSYFDEEWVDEFDITPGVENASIPEIDYPDSLMITEIYPSPQPEEVEWLELFNFGDEDVSLTDWYIEDNSNRFVFEENIIKPKEYRVIKEDDLGLTLNNSGEAISLFDPNDQEVDYFSYENTEKGLSNIRKLSDGEYLEEVVQTQKVTKGEENEYIDPSDLFYEKEVIDIAGARDFEIGEEVCVNGFITSPLNKLGSKTFYIQDETGGIQVYLRDESFWKDWEVGEKLKILGELKESYNEKRLYVSSESALLALGGQSAVKDEAKTVSSGDIGEEVEGQLVIVSGKIIETSGKTFYIDDGSGEIKVQIKSSTNIDTPSKKAGQYAAVLGIVSQYRDEYKVLPMEETDILISNEPISLGDVLGVAGFEIVELVVLGGVLFFVGLIWLQREKDLN